jgi:protein arginine kinase activator
MICQRCQQRPAEVRYAEVVSGSKRTRWLCMVCAPAEGLIVSSPAPSTTGAVPEPPPRANASLQCERCATTFDAIRRTGRVGCAACYQVFRAHLEPLLRRVHRSVEHVGRQPAPGIERRKPAELRLLRQELARAIHDEDYERAARLRDEIHARPQDAPPGEGAS